MSEDSVNDTLEKYARLRTLSPLFLKGWAKLHPMPERDRDLIEQAFSQTKKATKEKAVKALSQKAKTGSVRKQSATKAKPNQSQTKTQGPSHSH